MDNKEEVIAWISEIEKMSGVDPVIGNGPTCKTGDEYVEIVCSRSGEHIFDGTATRYATSELAWKAWIEAFSLYRSNRSGPIHWRVRPEMTRIKLDEWEDLTPEDIGYTVYSRLFIEKDK